MAHHVFYPSPELPHQVESYTGTITAREAEFGKVTGNSAAELAPVLEEAKRLQPLADEIEQLQIQLAARLDAYHKAAAPLWTRFSERVGFARVYADKEQNPALAAFLKGFRHNEGRHAASKQGK